ADSAHLEWNLDGLLEMVWEYLDLCRLYTKPKGLNPDYEDPVILSSKRKTVEDFCNQIHKDMAKQFKYALVWGSSVKHKPQRVGKVCILQPLSCYTVSFLALIRKISAGA
uniref:TGS domain-containing protein n=1 Tax=Aegilops tauschii subsp. strangulata TaxID=200361 RepID=A0A453B0V5_AEGTS